MNPEISVIIPSYNRYNMLIHVIRSILSQTIPVAEIIVVDDGSQDETPQKLPRLVAEMPEWKARVRYVHQENQGQCAAVNYGLTLAKGDWIAFAAHDDPWLPWKLEWQLRALRQYGDTCGLCFTDAWFMNNPHMKQTVFQFSGYNLPGPTGIVDNPTRMVIGPHPVWIQTAMIRADLLHRAGDLDPNLRYSEDHDLLFRMSLLTKFCYVSMPMVLIDRSPAQIRHVGAGENWHKVEYCLRMDQYRFEKQLRLSDGLPQTTRSLICGNLRANHSHWANWHLRLRDYAQARQSARTARRYRTTFSSTFKWLLIVVAPVIARMVFVARDNRNPERPDRTSWQTESEPNKEACGSPSTP